VYEYRIIHGFGGAPTWSDDMIKNPPNEVINTSSGFAIVANAMGAHGYRLVNRFYQHEAPHIQTSIWEKPLTTEAVLEDWRREHA
jgi:hypothetical protein